MKRDYIKRVFIDLKVLKTEGIWFSGVEKDGEFKEWYKSGQLWSQSFYKNNKLDGEFKRWSSDGQLIFNRLYKNGRVVKNYIEWK